MITFNNTVETAFRCVGLWNQKIFLTEVTVIRDVYGKVTLLMGNIQSIDEADKAALVQILDQNMGHYFNRKIYWKKLSHNQRKKQEREKIIVDIIEQERLYQRTEDGIAFYLSERAIAKKAWVRRPENQESVWPYAEAVADHGSKVITFYSFKGGMGRTTALAGTALILAEQGKNVMMIDTDIEAPGLASLFFDEDVIGKGVLDYLIEHEIDRCVSITDYVMDVTEPALLQEDEGQLFLMPAGRVDQSYLQKLARIDYQDNREGYLKESLIFLLNEIKNNYNVDYILVDARAGFHDMGGVAVTWLPHAVVLFGNDSRQSWDGITQVLRVIAEGHAGDFPVMIAGTMCPKPVAAEFAAFKERFIRKAYTVCVENYYDAENGIPGIEAEGENHFPELIPFQDELLQGIELFSDGSPEKNQRVNAYKTILTGESYQKIAGRIKNWFGEG